MSTCWCSLRAVRAPELTASLCPAFLTSFFLARAGFWLWACFLGPEGPLLGTRKQVQGKMSISLGLGVRLAVPGTGLQGSWGQWCKVYVCG